MLQRFLQPHFVWRPSQFVRAIRAKFAGRPADVATIQLPWGARIRFPTHDYIGHLLYMHGIVALEACESVFRLLDAGETAVDAGANVGTVSSSMVKRTGKNGKVTAFEMMPQTFKYLSDNFNEWKATCPGLEAVNCPLSDQETTINIGLSPDFANNTGVAYASHGDICEGHTALTAQAKRLDSFFPAPLMIHFLKLDVERHEHSVLNGAEELLKSGRIRDIVFEDITLLDTPVKQLLHSHHYTLFSLHTGLFRVTLTRIDSLADSSIGTRDECSDYLATRDPDRAMARWAKSGYTCLGSAS